MTAAVITIIILFIIFLLSSIRILREYERGVILRLGRFHKTKGPGIIIVWPIIDRMFRIGLRVITHDVPPQDIITRDNVSVKVNAVVFYRVFDPEKAIIEVENYMYATSQLAQTTMRSVLGQAELDELLSARDKINQHLQSLLDRATDAWGIKVTNVEVKHVDLPDEMKRAMAKQAEAERERRAKVINAEGELQAATKLYDAANIMSKEPISVQLRFLQTLREVSAENNTTTIFPVPIDLFRPFIRMMERMHPEAGEES